MKRLLLLTLFYFSISGLFAADYYWVGDSGSWSDANAHWATTSGGTTFHNTPPTKDDNVYFDDQSFSSNGGTVTLFNVTAQCLSMDWSGINHAVELYFGGPSELEVYGDLILSDQVDITFGIPSSNKIELRTSGNGRVVQSADKNLNSVKFSGSGSWILSGNLSASNEIEIENGNLDLAGYAVNTQELDIRNGADDLDFSNSTINTGELLIGNVDSLNLMNSTVTAEDVQIAPLGIVFHNLILAGNNVELSGNHVRFGSLTLSGTDNNRLLGGDFTVETELIATQPGSTVEVQAGATIYLNGTLSSQGNYCTGIIRWQSTSAGTAFNFYKTTSVVQITNVELKDVKGIGGAMYEAGSSIDLGNNTGWTIDELTPRTFYWINDNGGNWSDPSNWSASPGGLPGMCLPTRQDSVIFEGRSFNSAMVLNPEVIIDEGGQAVGFMSWEGATKEPKLIIPSSTTLEITGDFTLSSGMQFQMSNPSNSSILLSAAGSVDIKSAGHDLANLIIDGPGGVFNMEGELRASTRIQLLSGKLVSGANDIVTNDMHIDGDDATLDITDGVLNATERIDVLSFDSLLTDNSSILTNLLSVDQAMADFGEIILIGNNASANFYMTSTDFLLIQSTGVTSIRGGVTVTELMQLQNPGGELVVEAGSTLTLNDISASGAPCGGEIFLHSSMNDQFFVIDFTGSSAPQNLNYLILKDSRVAGITLNARQSVDLGNNLGWEIGQRFPDDLYWIGGTGEWNDPSHWSDTTGGAPIGCIPGPLDNVYFDHASFNAANQVVTIPGGASFCRDMIWKSDGADAITNLPILQPADSSTLYIYGSIQMASTSKMLYNPDYVTTSKIILDDDETDLKIKSGGHDLFHIVISGDGTWTLEDDLLVNDEIFIMDGQFATAGQEVNVTRLTVSGEDVVLSLGESDIYVDQLRLIEYDQLDAGTSSITMITMLFPVKADIELYDLTLIGLAPRLATEGLTVNNLNFNGSGTHVVSGVIDVQGDLSFNVPGSTVSIEAGDSLLVQGDITSMATSSQSITFLSNNPGVTSYLHKPNGIVCLEHMNIKDIHAVGGATFGAMNSLDGGNTDGWRFNVESNCAIFFPIECVDFAAEWQEGEGVQLRWVTASEQANAGFDLQKSHDGLTYESIAWIAGQGNSVEPVAYQYLDADLESTGIRYYRLLQQDEDGTINPACRIINIQIANDLKGFLLAPNPAGDQTTLFWSQAENCATRITIFDITGRVRLERNISSQSGSHQIALDVQRLPKGIYPVRLHNACGNDQVLRLVKQ